jgi:ABC-type multidrug transport system fused ATPase/permease subunit
MTAFHKERKEAATSDQAWTSLPDAWALMKPRRMIMVVGFVLMVVNRLSGLILPASTKYLFDNVILKKQTHLLIPLTLAVVGATLVDSVTAYSLTQLISKSAQRMITDLRVKVQAHVGRLPLSFYDANKTGALVSRIMSDVEGVRNLVGTGIVHFIGGLVTALFALVLLFRTSVLMTTVACAGLIVFGIRENRVFKILRPAFRSRFKINAEVTGRLTESLAGVRVVKGYHAEEREEKVFRAGAHRMLANVFETLTATSLSSVSTTFMVGIVSAIIMLIGAHQILIGKLTPGGLISYAAFLAILITPVTQMVGVVPEITEALAGLERTRELLNQTPENEDPARTIRLDRITGLVAFENVSFSYDSGTPVLCDVSFKAEPDTVTALVGPSGAGKSTTIGLIVAFYLPTSGRVLVDGIDLTTVQLDSFRTQLGVVLQDSFLFDGTIRENVAFGRSGASEQEILEACRIARVDEFAEKLEGKYGTLVGERGVKLSGGQKQRVSIARAILADPRILILDEATSSLDSEAEALIQEGLRYLMRGRTTFVIAHRLSTIRRADQILVFESGRIIEHGKHESLYAAGGRYYDLYTKQHGLQTNLFLAPGEVAGDFDELNEGKE